MEIYIITMESESYSWIATGTTLKQAKKSLLNEWNAAQREAKECYPHGEFRPTYYRSFDELEEYYGVNITCLKPGECERL